MENKPVKLTSPRVWRTYVGGSLIDAIHGVPEGRDGQFPEEWIMSVVNARNVGREHILDEGLCYLDGTEITLRDHIASNPEDTLGKAHLEKLGVTTGVLVKIIDSAERLTVQAHPDKRRAIELFGSPFGKTECWHILGCRTIDDQEPCIYLGFREGITREYWKRCFDLQDIPAMLGCLHRFPVKAGETYLIPGGVPHAIGAGCLLIEIQEPTDYTVRTERVTPKGLRISDHQCHQGLGFEKMFDCFSYEGLSMEEAGKRFCVPGTNLAHGAWGNRTELVGEDWTDCFRLERFEILDTGVLPAMGVMSGLYVISGCGTMECAGEIQRFSAGEQFFVGADCAAITVEPEEPVIVFRCFGPSV